MSLLGPEDRPVVLRRLLEAREARGSVPSALVHQGAAALGVGVSTVWGWLSREEVPDGRRGGYELTTRDKVAYFECSGSAAAAYRQLLKEGAPTADSLRNFQRAIGAQLSPAERAFARRGMKGRRQLQLYIERQPTTRNGVWEGDHKRLDVLVTPLRGRKPLQPWITPILEDSTRAIASYAVSLRPTRGEVLAALGSAVRHEPERTPVFGLPDVIRWDNGLEFTADAVTAAAVMLNALVLPTRPYSPHQKGKVERFHHTLTQEFISTLPHYTGGPRAADGRLYQPKEPPMSLSAFLELLEDWIRHYNNDRPHSALGGRTPADAWDADATPVRTIPDEDLRRFLLEAGTRKVGREGVSFEGLHFIAPELNELVGRVVEVRSRPHDRRSIEIYLDGAWRCTAYPARAASPELTQQVKDRRREDARQATRLIKARNRRQATRLRAMTEPTTPELADVMGIDEARAAIRRPRTKTSKPRRNSDPLGIANRVGGARKRKPPTNRKDSE